MLLICEAVESNKIKLRSLLKIEQNVLENFGVFSLFQYNHQRNKILSSVMPWRFPAWVNDRFRSNKNPPAKPRAQDLLFCRNWGCCVNRNAFINPGRSIFYISCRFRRDRDRSCQLFYSSAPCGCLQYHPLLEWQVLPPVPAWAPPAFGSGRSKPCAPYLAGWFPP